MMKELISLIQGIGDMKDTVKEVVQETMHDIERRVEKTYRRLQKKILLGLIEVTFVFLGILFLIFGFMLLLHKYIGLEVILLVSGALLLYTALLVRLSQK